MPLFREVFCIAKPEVCSEKAITEGDYAWLFHSYWNGNEVEVNSNGYGFRVQKSAFEALITEQQYGKLIDELPKMLDKAEDSIRVYRFRGYGDVKLLGVSSQIKNEDVIII